MTVPVIRAFINQNPNVKITVLSKPFLAPLFSNINNVDFFAADVKGKHKGFIGILKLFLTLKKLNFTEVADLHNVLRSIVLRNLFKLSFTKVKYIDKGRREKKELTRLENKIFKPLKLTVERYADVFRKLGFQVNLKNPKFPEKIALTKKIITITGIKNNIWVGIAPFAQYQTKMYPLPLMEKVIEQLNNQKNIRIYLFGGGQNEVNILNKLSEKYEHVISIAGKFNLNEELAIIRNLNLMLSMDSGNAHFAAMQGVKTLTLWGATHPYAGFRPFNQPIDFCLTPNRKNFPKLPTSVYGNKKVEGYESVMETIKPNFIVSKILKEL
ncbi:MAG: glycosyltransferase family 9 protein [Lutibacter sp.]